MYAVAYLIHTQVCKCNKHIILHTCVIHIYVRTYAQCTVVQCTCTILKYTYITMNIINIICFHIIYIYMHSAYRPDILIHARSFVHNYVHTHVRMYVRAYVRMYVLTYTHTRTFIHIHAQ